MTPWRIMELVAARAGLPTNDLIARRRERRRVHARQVAAWLMREQLGMSYPAIAHVLRRDHTTALYAVRQVTDALAAAAEGRETPLATLAAACMRDVQRSADPAWRAYLDACRRRNHLRRISGGWQGYLASLRRRNAAFQVSLRREARARRARLHHRKTCQHGSALRPRFSGPVPVIVPRGRTITQTLMGDPSPERSALAARQRAQRPARFDRHAFLNSLRIHQEEATQ